MEVLLGSHDGAVLDSSGEVHRARPIYCDSSNSKFESNFTIKHSVPLRSLWVSAYLERSRRATSRDRRSLIVGWSRKSFVVTFS
ncbi:rho GTPase-activating protein 20-like [Erinaceus europaeus]|uniref:Rho GTPase-activating protein 20-like n=1 Tax=Erinaceus europaeus TaxID=9365 RepID=A0ABM3VV46_ERIEU|nr:rho GTPase-activating protein 20-like [Erinaceus europaeus]XP_060028200.1 rho GTPase-activating protein 20-like [Erinaceus europaeus]